MAARFQDYYETLGVARGASPEEIKLGFRKLARLHHPDVAKNKVAGEAKFKEINEAYEVLGDPEKRRRYDELGADRREAVAPEARRPTHSAPGDEGFEFGGTGFSDFYESFFGGGSGGKARRGSRGDPENDSQPGRDLEADLLVTLEEVLHGSRRKVTLRRPGPAGIEPRLQTYQVRVPPGVHEGQRIRLAGQGGSGSGGAAAGDLHLRVRLARHPDFTVQGSDLYADLDLAPWEAVLGAQIKIPTLDGFASLGVPPGTAAGRQLRLRGLGLPGETGARGDLYATAHVRTPDPVTAEERLLWEQLARVSRFQARAVSPDTTRPAGAGETHPAGNTP